MNKIVKFAPKKSKLERHIKRSLHSEVTCLSLQYYIKQMWWFELYLISENSLEYVRCWVCNAGNYLNYPQMVLEPQRAFHFHDVRPPTRNAQQFISIDVNVKCSSARRIFSYQWIFSMHWPINDMTTKWPRAWEYTSANWKFLFSIVFFSSFLILIFVFFSSFCFAIKIHVRSYVCRTWKFNEQILPFVIDSAI